MGLNRLGSHEQNHALKVLYLERQRPHPVWGLQLTLNKSLHLAINGVVQLHEGRHDCHKVNDVSRSDQSRYEVENRERKRGTLHVSQTDEMPLHSLLVTGRPHLPHFCGNFAVCRETLPKTTRWPANIRPTKKIDCVYPPTSHQITRPSKHVQPKQRIASVLGHVQEQCCV